MPTTLLLAHPDLKTGRRNVTNKKGLLYSNFFQFEEFFHPFLGGSIQPQHTVRENRYFRLPLQCQYLDQNHHLGR